ncbi:hypothetical protein FQN57_006103 [Myotisia sp. PD_48]|nr:hypothetical protein FQN57_006103 [Myotisia sp. PD_48]
MAFNDAGGFLPAHLPSPAPSTAGSVSTVTSRLPRQRNHPLRPGSAKEITVINYVDSHILNINRRHAKKFSGVFSQHVEGRGGGGQQRKNQNEETESDSVPGYGSFKEVVNDLEPIINVLWVSGTPSLQVPYLISLAGLVNSYLVDFPFMPRSTFRLLHKLDDTFASLLLGEDVETGAKLPGYEYRKDQVSMTEKVRIKSITEHTRMTIFDVADKVGGSVMPDEEEEEEEEEEDGDEGDDENEDVGNDIGGDFADPLGRWEMEAAKVYEKTVQLLGDELGKQEVV